jgi:hypothetical protein
MRNTIYGSTLVLNLPPPILRTYYGIFSRKNEKAGREMIIIRKLGQFWQQDHAHVAAEKAKRSVIEKVLEVFVASRLLEVEERHVRRIVAERALRIRDDEKAAAR